MASIYVRSAWLAVACLAAARTLAAAAGHPCPPPRHGKIARRVAEVLPVQHLSRHNLDDAISARAWTNYIHALDPDHVYFLNADIEQLSEHAVTLDDALRNGDLTFAYEAVELCSQRLINRVAYAKSLVYTGFDFTRDEQYAIPQNHGWVATRDEWDFVWRKKTKNENLCQLINAMLDGDGNSIEQVPERTLATYDNLRNSPPARTDAEWILRSFLTAFTTAYDPDSEYVPPAGTGEPPPPTTVAGENETTTWSIRTPATANGNATALGIIRLPSFYGNARAGATRDVTRVLAHMKREKVGGVLLDLRGNVGGCQPETVTVTGLFIADGPVVLTRKAGLPVEQHCDPDRRTAYAGPLVVLVNRLTASAAEVLTGTLQDYGRAVVVGDSRTYGKGCCQTLHPLDVQGRLGGLRITTEVNYRVSGRSSQGCGVIPDIVLPSAYDACFDAGAVSRATEPPVAAADFTPIGDLSATVARLRERSVQRRGKDPRYAAQAERLAEAARLARERSVPLQRDKRLALMRCFRALHDVRELLSANKSSPPSAPDMQPDLVLEEALAILGDLAELTAGQ